MRFGKTLHPLNFDYLNNYTIEDNVVSGKGSCSSATIRCDVIDKTVLRLRIDNHAVVDKQQYSRGIDASQRIGDILAADTDLPGFRTNGTRLQWRDRQLIIELTDGTTLATDVEGIGFNGEQLAIHWQVDQISGFYGCGEKTGKLNKSGTRLDFWNNDVVADHPYSYQRDDYEPGYVSIPWLIIKSDSRYLGLYFDNPGRCQFDIGQRRPGILSYYSLTGNTDLYVVTGTTLRQVVRNFAALTGRHELPPVWALGYHQCRWGYQNEADFLELKDRFARFDIPVSVLWHDIDYMDGYRVFTWNEQAFPDPARLGNTLKQAGIHSVTIVDPGVKLDPGYPVYDRGQEQDVFCKTGNGRDFVGVVWPGDTVFPDFSLDTTRQWWADHLNRFMTDSAIDGAWLDMNEPATVEIFEDDLLFDHGNVPHHRYHNQYGLMMAMASRQAFAEDQRPFLLTRSAFTGIQRYAAVWTGDNVSNWSHLRMSIPMTLNLGLSGVAFNGPDVGGFMGNTTAELLIRWFQAGFLFPFFRNHAMRDSKTQEPWQFGDECLRCTRDAIVTRYRLLPYLYNLFFEHWLTGDPILRPLLYDQSGEEYENLDEQFLIGDALLAAPIVHGEGSDRTVVIGGVKRHLRYITLPPGWWFDLNLGQWQQGGQTLSYGAAIDESPLFVRDGSVIPWYPGTIDNSRMDWQQLELHIFCHDRPAQMTLYLDDRQTRRYRGGQYNTVTVTASPDDQSSIGIDEQGPLPVGQTRFRPVVYGRDTGPATLTVNGRTTTLNWQSVQRRWLARQLTVLEGNHD